MISSTVFHFGRALLLAFLCDFVTNTHGLTTNTPITTRHSCFIGKSSIINYSNYKSLPARKIQQEEKKLFSRVSLISKASSPKRTQLYLASNSKEEEIAKLEEQLRKLKEEGEQQQEPQTDNIEEGEASSAVSSIPTNDYVGRGPAKRPVKPMEEMLSEAWKEQENDANSGIGGKITTILAGVVFIVFLAFFSQIPVGQEDLSKYQAIKTGSTTQIDLGDLNQVRSTD